MSKAVKEKKIMVKIQRFNPRVDEDIRFQVYEVPIIKGLSIMNILDYIYENMDGTLAYYSHSACRRGVCGRCLLIINGRAGLACQTMVHGDLTLETPPKSRVIKDLVYSAPSLFIEEEDIFFID